MKKNSVYYIYHESNFISISSNWLAYIKVNYVIPLEEVKVEEGDLIQLIVNYYEFKNDEPIPCLFLAKYVDKTFSKNIITLRKIKLVEC